MQRIVGVRAGETLNFSVKRGDSTLQLKGTPEFREVKDSFGNVHRLGVLGITRATSPGDVVTERVDPATAAWLGVKETWFVVERTLSYIGGVFTGREAADQVGGPLRIAQISGQVATIGVVALIHLAAVLSISIGLLEPVSGAAARWRSPFVLCGGGGPGTTAVGARPGSGVPNRAGIGAYVDGVCDLQRHPAPGGIVKRLFCDVAHWQRLGMKLESYLDVWFAAPGKLATSSATVGFCRFVGVRAGIRMTRARCA